MSLIASCSSSCKIGNHGTNGNYRRATEECKIRLDSIKDSRIQREIKLDVAY